MVLTFDIRCLTSGNEKKMHIPNCNIQGSETNIFFSYIDYIKKLSPRIQFDLHSLIENIHQPVRPHTLPADLFGVMGHFT